MSYNIDLSGRVALVTGASSGLGQQFAKTLAKAGAGVVLAGRRIERLKTLRAEIEAEGGDAHVVALDVTDHDSIKSAVAHAETEMGTLDILINNSGVSTTQKLTDVTPGDFDYVMDTNLRGAFLMTRAAAKLMVRQRSGRIINIASTAGAMGSAGQANYSAAKAGLIGLTKSTARELAHWGILVNAVAPGLIETDMAKAIPDDARDALLAQVPLKRIGSAREVAEMVGFLAGDGAAYVTGQVFHVNGGLYM